jgi:hypothetical protein
MQVLGLGTLTRKWSISRLPVLKEISGSLFWTIVRATEHKPSLQECTIEVVCKRTQDVLLWTDTMLWVPVRWTAPGKPGLFSIGQPQRSRDCFNLWWLRVFMWKFLLGAIHCVCSVSSPHKSPVWWVVSNIPILLLTVRNSERQWLIQSHICMLKVGLLNLGSFF